jgi:hypothetical protein
MKRVPCKGIAGQVSMSEEPDADHEDPGAAAARLRGKRAALGLVIVVSLLFIVSSAGQIIPAVFGAGFTPLPAGAPPGSAEQRCAEGVRTLADALDRAGGRLSSVAAAADEEDIKAALRPILSPEWDRAEEVQSACDQAQGGPSAWASLQRLLMAEEQSGRLDRGDIRAVQRDVAAHLPADLR